MLIIAFMLDFVNERYHCSVSRCIYCHSTNDNLCIPSGIGNDHLPISNKTK